MQFSTTKEFWQLLTECPADIQDRVPKKLSMWEDNQRHPSLHFKKVSKDSEPSVWSIRVSDDYRMLGYRQGDHVMWYWVGKHDEYIRIINRLQ